MSELLTWLGWLAVIALVVTILLPGGFTFSWQSAQREAARERECGSCVSVQRRWYGWIVVVHHPQVPMTSGQAPTVHRAAKELHDFLWNHTGGTADWPIRITVDDEQVKARLETLLNNLKRALEAGAQKNA